ncbi:MAG: hypothetical protein ABSF34_01250 [Verrucomicrobiota bacterium]
MKTSKKPVFSYDNTSKNRLKCRWTGDHDGLALPAWTQNVAAAGPGLALLKYQAFALGSPAKAQQQSQTVVTQKFLKAAQHCNLLLPIKAALAGWRRCPAF